ncbi:MAG: PAS domain-containing sensor histidine kinase [Bacteroidia bacterium]
MQTNLPLSINSLKEGVLANVLEKTPFAFSLMSEDYVVDFANDTYLEIVGKAREEVVGRNLFTLFPEVEDQLSDLLQYVKETGEPFHSPEYSIKLLRNGEMQEVFFNFIYHPIYSATGVFEHYVTFALEITDLVQAKIKLRDDEERIRLATEGSETATWDLNLLTREIVHSAEVANVFGYPSDVQLTHAMLRDHINIYDRIHVVEKAYKEALQTGIYRYEARLKDKNGIDKWIFTYGKVVFDDQGIATRMLGVMQDITARKFSEIQLQLSHHQLNTAMEATRLGRFDMNPETLEKYNFSPRFLEIFGYDPETEAHLIDSKILERHIHENFICVRENALIKAKETGDLYYQTQIVLRDGSTKWIELYGKMLPESKGQSAYISGTIRDITESKLYEERLSESEKKYRFLADAMPQIVWIGDPDGKLTYFNKATIDYSGKDYNAFIAEDGWIDIVHPEERQQNIKKWEKSVTTKTPFIFEHRFRSKDDEYRWFLSRAYPDLDEKGNVKRWVGTSTDIDDMKKQEKHKNEFIKMANHELKTPVTTIKGYVQLLKKMRSNSEDQFLVNSLNTIENQVNKLNSLIGELLDISRIESGKLPLHKRAFSLLELVTETIEDIKAAEQSHQIEFELLHETDVEVFADKERITQVLNNLLTNAIKYSPRANLVNVKLSVDDHCAIVSVRDFGIGMDKAELTKIFQRFYRVSGDDEGTFPGFGIGLFIVKDILKRHHGKIWVESEKDKGSEFFFALPLNRN